MPYLAPTKKQYLLEKRARKQADLDEMEAALKASAYGGIASYQLNTGEGDQRTQYIRPEEIKKIISWLEGEIESINQELRGTGVVNLNLRRKNYRRGFYGI